MPSLPSKPQIEGDPRPAQGKPAVPTDMGALLFYALPSLPFHAKVATIPWVEGVGCD